MDKAAVRLVVLNAVIALAAVVPATALTMVLDSCGAFGGRRDCDIVGELYGVLTLSMPSLGLLAASGIAYVVLLVIVGSFVPINRLAALVMSPLAAVPLGIALWPHVLTPIFVALVGSYCLIIGLLVRRPATASQREDRDT